MQSEAEVDKEDLYTLNINCKGKRTVEKANKETNVDKITNNKKLKLEKEKKMKTPQNCKSPMQRQRFITTVKNVTGGEKKLKNLIRFHNTNKIDN